MRFLYYFNFKPSTKESQCSRKSSSQHGADLNTLWGDDAEDVGTSVGFNAGLGVKISLPLLPITLAPELLVDMRNFNNELSLFREKVSLTTWAIDIPVMVRFSLLPILYIEGGPQFAFNISTTGEFENGKDAHVDDFYEFSTFEFDLAFGVGTGIVPFVDIDFRVVLGMSNFIDDYSDAGIVTKIIGDKVPEVANLQFMLGATYWF